MDYREPTRLSWTSALLFTAVLTLLAFLIANGWKKDVSAVLGEAVPLNVSAFHDVVVNDNYIYSYDGSVLHCISQRGVNQWRYSAGVDAAFSVTEHGIACWTSNKLTSVDPLTGTTQYTGTMEKDILSAKVGASYIAVVLKPEQDSTLLVMDAKGVLVDTIPMNHMTLLDYGFFSTGVLWTMALDNSGTVPSCTLTTYNPGKRTAGSISDTEQVLYAVVFRSTQICAVGTTHIHRYDYSCTLQDSTLVYGYYLAAADRSTDNPMMLFVPNRQYDGLAMIQDVRMIRGSADRIVHLPYTCFSVGARGDTMYGFSSEYLVTCKLGNSVCTTYKMPISADTVIGITTDKTAILSSSGALYAVQLP